jgi:hypothetical protein
MNGLMRPVYEQAQALISARRLRREYRKIVAAGFRLDSGRIYLTAYHRARAATASAMEPWEAERWVNDVHLESARPASDPAWRADVLTQGLILTRGLLPIAAALASVPVQADLSLQSAAGHVDPETDFPAGTVHFIQVREPADDMRASIERFSQPLLVAVATGAIRS